MATSYDDDNIFAKIIRGDIPSHKVFENDTVLAILDAFPAAKGHTLVIPKAKAVTVDQLTAEQAADLFSHVPRIAKAVVAATGCAGYNLIQNNGKVAGQEVPHVHIHIVPRDEDDGKRFVFESAKSMIDVDAAKALVAHIQSNLQ